MKTYIAILFATLLFNFSSAQGIEFFHGTFEEAQEAAKAQNKLIFMDAYAVWCGPCKMMTNQVFPQKEVGEFFNQHFINLKVDMEKGEGVDLRRKYGVSAYPTLFILSSDGEVVNSIRGARQAADLIKWAQQATLPNKNMVEQLQEKYDNGNRTIGLLRDLIKVKSAYKEDFSDLFNEYISLLSPEEIIDEQNANFIFDYTNDTESKGLAIIQSYADYFKDLKGSESYNSKFNDIATSTAYNAINAGDEEQLNNALSFLKKYKLPDYQAQSQEFKVAYYWKNEDWNNYDKEVSKYLKKYKKGNTDAYQKVAWNYYMKIDDEAKLKKAEKWMQQAIKINNNYENNLTQAYLLYKLEDYSAAEDAVNYAIILAGDTKKTDNAQILKDKIQAKLGKTPAAAE